VRELRPGLWHWTAFHPEWTEQDDQAGHVWGPEVSSYAFVLSDRLVMIDPVVPAGGLDELIAGRSVVTLLTCPWHARDAAKVDGPRFAPPPDPEDTDPLASEIYRAGDRPLAGVTAFEGLEPIDLVLWVEEYGALVFGDTLVDLGHGLELPTTGAPAAFLTPMCGGRCDHYSTCRSNSCFRRMARPTGPRSNRLWPDLISGP
jgi:hypothetical protein